MTGADSLSPKPTDGCESTSADEQNVDLDDASEADDSVGPGPAVEPGSASDPVEPTAPEGAEQSGPTDKRAADDEGPRRRARRERAERRVVQERATAIEEARREAKRRVLNASATTPKTLGKRAVRGLRLLTWAVVLTVVSVGLGLILYFTPLMSARDLVVVGTGEVTRDQVVDAAKVATGTPLLQIDTDDVADRVAGIRRVASARVQREYPSTLRITIVERVPVVVKDYPDGPHLFDRDGVDFATAPPPTGLAYIDVDNPGPTDPPTKAALQVMTALLPDVAAQISRVSAPSVASITLTLLDGRTVVWGTTDRTEEKAEKLTALLTQPGRTYDVSSPDLPTVK